MGNIDFVYVTLNLLLLFVFYRAGVNVSKGHNYWGNAWGCIVTFTFVLGARYMRGNDYGHYLDVYKHDLEADQKVYTFMCDFMKAIGINEYASFFVYAFIFSLCLFVFLKRYRQYGQYIFPFALMFMLFFHEFMIRQELSYAFVFLYINKLTQIEVGTKFKKLFQGRNLIVVLWCLLLFYIIIGIHSANALVVLAFTAVYFLYYRPIPWIVTIPALLFCTYYLQKHVDFGLLSPILSHLGSSDEKFSGYAENSDMWFSAEGANDIYTRNPIVGVLEVVSECAFFVLFPKLVKDKGNMPIASTFYNCCVGGILFQTTFLNLEIMNRMGFVMRILIFFPLALVFYYRKQICSTWLYKMMFVCLFFLFYDYLKYVFYKGVMTKFLWDI